MYKLFIEWLRIKLDLPELNDEYVCESCEILKLENAHLHNEVNRLLDHILNPKIEEVDKTPREFKPIQSGRKNWNLERIRLEREDAIKNDTRLKENALKAAGQKDPSAKEEKREEATNITAPSNIIGVNKTIEELENELSVELPDKVVGEN